MTEEAFSQGIAYLLNMGLQFLPKDEQRFLKMTVPVWYAEYFKDIEEKSLKNAIKSYVENEDNFPTLHNLLDYIAVEGGRSRIALEMGFRRDYPDMEDDLKAYIRKFSDAFDWRQMKAYQKEDYINTKLIPAYLQDQRRRVIARKQIKGA